MRVLLYTELANAISESGLGKAIKHQQTALKINDVDYTLNIRDNYDIIHINTSFLRSYFLAKEARRKGKKVVYHAHSTKEDFRNSFVFSNALSPLAKIWFMMCYETGDYIVTPTLYSKRILESYGIKKPIMAISNGIDTSFFAKDTEAGIMFRETYGFSPTDKIVLGIGLCIARKGILDFVELAKRMPEYHFVWFGNTHPFMLPGKVRKALGTNLDNLHFEGYVERDMIKAALSGCDLYLCTTYEETEGIPVLESLAMKQRTLVRDIPIFEEWLTDSVNVYKAKNNDEFQEKIHKIINGELPDLSEEGYKVVQERELDKIGRQLKDMYTDVLRT